LVEVIKVLALQLFELQKKGHFRYATQPRTTTINYTHGRKSKQHEEKGRRQFRRWPIRGKECKSGS
jgi:hypothetical protein